MLNESLAYLDRKCTHDFRQFGCLLNRLCSKPKIKQIESDLCAIEAQSIRKTIYLRLLLNSKMSNCINYMRLIVVSLLVHWRVALAGRIRIALIQFEWSFQNDLPICRSSGAPRKPIDSHVTFQIQFFLLLLSTRSLYRVLNLLI